MEQQGRRGRGIHCVYRQHYSLMMEAERASESWTAVSYRRGWSPEKSLLYLVADKASLHIYSIPVIHKTTDGCVNS
jgi:hypothetical protein